MIRHRKTSTAFKHGGRDNIKNLAFIDFSSFSKLTPSNATDGDRTLSNAVDNILTLFPTDGLKNRALLDLSYVRTPLKVVDCI